MGKKIGLPTAVCLGNRADPLPVDTVSFAIGGEGFFESEGPCRCAVVMEMLQPLDAFRPVGNMPPATHQSTRGGQLGLTFQLRACFSASTCTPL